MKKVIIGAVLVAAIGTASAVEVGVRATHYGANDPSLGVSLGQKFGAFGVEGAFDRSIRGTTVNRTSLIGSYDVAKVAGITFAAKAGVARVSPSVGDSGTAGLVGVGASYPLTKSVSLVADYAYQHGQDRIRAFNGNNLSAGLKVAF